MFHAVVSKFVLFLLIKDCQIKIISIKHLEKNPKTLLQFASLVLLLILKLTSKKETADMWHVRKLANVESLRDTLMPAIIKVRS